MRYDIKNRYTHAVICAAEIDARDDTSPSAKTGLAVRWAMTHAADLYCANLRCVGNMRELRTMQIDTWPIGYTHDTLQIGCQRHVIDKWRRWDSEAGRKWIDSMDDTALEWADRNLALVLQIIDANPATSKDTA